MAFAAINLVVVGILPAEFCWRGGIFMAERKTQEAPSREIERRAYELYLERGGEDGHDIDDWIQAEREVGRLAEKSRLGSQVGTQDEPRRSVERSGDRPTERSSCERGADRNSLSDSLNSTVGKRL
jgi:hypothetical protein